MPALHLPRDLRGEHAVPWSRRSSHEEDEGNSAKDMNTGAAFFSKSSEKVCWYRTPVLLM